MPCFAEAPSEAEGEVDEPALSGAEGDFLLSEPGALAKLHRY